jgi:hypothetical protein
VAGVGLTPENVRRCFDRLAVRASRVYDHGLSGWIVRALEMDMSLNPPWRLASLPPKVIATCLVATVCYQADKLVYVLGIPPDHIASFWPATPFLVAALLLTSRKIWPLLIAAGLAGHGRFRY